MDNAPDFCYIHGSVAGFESLTNHSVVVPASYTLLKATVHLVIHEKDVFLLKCDGHIYKAHLQMCYALSPGTAERVGVTCKQENDN